MQTINLYGGFDGYQEIILTEESISNQKLFKVQLLAFHFESILSFIPLGVYDSDSVMYNYFKSQGWHDGKWECVKMQEFTGQLEALNNVLPNELLESHNALKQICNSALQNNNKLFISLE